MKRILWIILAAAAMVALPFLFRRPSVQDQWARGDPVLVIVSPHNEAIREEFGRAFSAWHAARHGRPVKVDWRVIGGTTEIMRYLASEYVGSMRAWWEREGRPWPAAGAEWMLDRRFDPFLGQDEVGERILLLDEGHCFRDQTIAACRLDSDPAGRTFAATSLSTIVEFVANGQGVTLLPRIALRKEASNPRIAIHDLVAPGAGRRLSLVWREATPFGKTFEKMAGAIGRAKGAA